MAVELNTTDARDDYLTREEIDEVLSAFEESKADSTRLVKMARIMCRAYGLVEWEAEDLISETMKAFLEGRRRWPRDNQAMAVFRRNMDWIARDEGRRIGRTGGRKEEISPGTQDLTPTPEQMAEASSTVEAILGTLSDDPVAQKIVEGWCRGLSPVELQRDLGLNDTEYSTRVRKIRRRIDKLALNMGRKGGGR